MKGKIEGCTDTPLRWPDDRPRTRLQDRKPQAAWKRTYAETLGSLEKELALLKVTSFVITHNTAGSEDGGAAVWFSFKPVDEYGWQEALGFIGVVPTVQEIDHSYMRRVQKYHPEGPTPNLTMFYELTKHRDTARAWALGKRTVEHEKVMAVDAFKEVRHNLNAVRLVMAALRQIERCGSPVMMEQAFRGFSKQITAGAGDAAIA